MSKVSSFGRRSGGRKQRRILLVLGDGISEKMYFDQINRMDIDMRVVSVATEETGFDGTFRKATNLIRRNNINIESGDRVAVVMDLDDRYSEKEMAELESRYSREGFEVFLSNPCFEVWLIQHFRTVNRKGDCRAMVGVLEEVFKREGLGDYRKSDGIPLDSDMVEKAIGYAEAKHRGIECTVTWCHGNNPSTMVHLLVNSLFNTSSRPAIRK